MAIGSPDKTARLDQLRTYARVQVRAGFNTAEEIRADVYDAVSEEVKAPAEAQRLTDDFLSAAHAELALDAADWPQLTQFDALQAAFAELEQHDVVILQACADHWAAHDELQRRAAEGRPVRGIGYFTHSDVWHAVEHQMLELNLWHGTSANVAPGDELLDLVLDVLARHGIDSLFDEGRLELTVSWQRRPVHSPA
ncbi:MAG: DUF6891 domain-containing protein [Nocardioidaceae bacterium]